MTSLCVPLLAHSLAWTNISRTSALNPMLTNSSSMEKSTSERAHFEWCHLGREGLVDASTPYAMHLFVLCHTNQRCRNSWHGSLLACRMTLASLLQYGSARPHHQCCACFGWRLHQGGFRSTPPLAPYRNAQPREQPHEPDPSSSRRFDES